MIKKTRTALKRLFWVRAFSSLNFNFLFLVVFFFAGMVFMIGSALILQ